MCAGFVIYVKFVGKQIEKCLIFFAWTLAIKTCGGSMPINSFEVITINHTHTEKHSHTQRHLAISAARESRIENVSKYLLDAPGARQLRLHNTLEWHLIAARTANVIHMH